jgi:hypothetical protein
MRHFHPVKADETKRTRGQDGHDGRKGEGRDRIAEWGAGISSEHGVVDLADVVAADEMMCRPVSKD